MKLAVGAVADCRFNQVQTSMCNAIVPAFTDTGTMCFITMKDRQCNIMTCILTRIIL